MNKEFAFMHFSFFGLLLIISLIVSPFTAFVIGAYWFSLLLGIVISLFK